MAAMKTALGLITLLLLLCQTARADTHCYTFRNDSPVVVTLNFSYQPLTGNVITGAALDSGKTYPFDGRPWCWNLPEEVTAVDVVPGQQPLPESPALGWRGQAVPVLPVGRPIGRALIGRLDGRASLLGL